MARRKTIKLSLTDAILRRLQPEIDGFTATIPMAIVIATLRFHNHLWDRFQQEFTGEDYIEWDVLRGWLMLMELN